MTAKRESTTTGTAGQSGPAASRPRIPADYGIPKDAKGLLPWSHVTERLTHAMHYWVCTITPDGRPHATPVDGLWLDDRLYFGGSPETRWRRNLAARPAVSIHLESATDVVILRGDARELKAPDRALAEKLSKASVEKYGYSPGPDAYEAGGVYVFRPRVALAWKQFPKDASRWEFSD
jgi:nitroimidazol reductase NimA-like FMN-containing flavoprotein (pyridoxamine 5'-phosphate oxidase superfamily)